MGDGMPYMVTKGPVWQFFDDWFSDPDPKVRLKHKIDALIAAHLNGDLFVAAPAPTPPDATTGIPENRPGSNDPNAAGQQRTMPNDHFGDWFDMHGFTGQCPEEPQPPWLTVRPNPTGWWNGWAGDAQAIAREAFIRTIEVSLGLEHVDPVAGRTKAEIKQAYQPNLDPGHAYDRNWAIEFWWICPLPSFQTSISWRAYQPPNRAGPGDPMAGSVAMTFLTPGMDITRASDNGLNDAEGLVSNLLRNPGPGGGSLQPPVSSAERIGSWLVGHQHTKDAAPEIVSIASLLGLSMPPQGPMKYGCDQIVTVSPEYLDGGVQPMGAKS
jgi:hypothetical protein